MAGIFQMLFRGVLFYYIRSGLSSQPVIGDTLFLLAHVFFSQHCVAALSRPRARHAVRH